MTNIIKNLTAFFVLCFTFLPCFSQSIAQQKELDSLYQEFERYLDDDNLDQGVATLIQYTEKYSNVMTCNSSDYTELLHLVAELYFAQEEYKQALVFEEKAINQCNFFDVEKDLLVKYLEFASLYAQGSKNIEESIEFGLEAWKYLETDSHDNDDKMELARMLGYNLLRANREPEAVAFLEFTCLNSFSSHLNEIYRDCAKLLSSYLACGQLGYAIGFINQIVSRKDYIELDKIAKAHLYFVFAKVYHQAGRLDDAIYFSKESLSYRREIYGEESHEYITQLLDLAGYKFFSADYINAADIAENALALSQKLQDHVSSSDCYSILGCIYEKISEEKAKEFKTKGLQLRLQIFGENSPEYATALLNYLPTSKDYIKDYEFIKNSYQKCLSIYEKCYGVNNEKYLHTLLLESLLEAINQNKEESFQLIHKYYTIGKEKMITNAKFLPSYSREKYWNFSNEFFNDLFVISSCFDFENYNLNALAYNALLWKKGFLLNLNNKSEEKRIHSQFSLNWEAIRNRLDKRDIAIEFLYTNGKYVALLISHDSNCPIWVNICDERTIISLNKKTPYSNDYLHDIYNIIWKPLFNYLSDKSNVYFSPDCILNIIPIEAALTEHNEPINDIHNFYRLSSTKEIVKDRAPIDITEFCLFGDLNYKLNDYSAEASQYSISNNSKSFPELTFSIEEINEIIKHVPENVRTNVYTGSQGTKHQFKLLSGRGTNCLHVSTHGVFCANVSPIEQHSLLNDDFERTEEYMSLQRAGLAMSFDEKDIYNTHNNILTANEISELDLSNLDIAILSACKTGIGDVHGDGVFGLQRGFKKAGTRSILMCLENISSVATSVFMSAFYKNYFSGQTKVNSYKEAQKEVREYKDDNGELIFHQPYYWASWILLDGVNYN